MSYLVISTSLREGSRSKIMAKALSDTISDVEFFDLQTNPLPMCDGDKCYDLPEVIDFREKVKNARGIIMAIPIYNYNVSSGAKNIIELGGKKLYDKVFGFICAAGGKSSYMSIMSFANSSASWFLTNCATSLAHACTLPVMCLYLAVVFRSSGPPVVTCVQKCFRGGMGG